MCGALVLRQKTQVMKSPVFCKCKSILIQLLGKLWTCFFTGFSFFLLFGAQVETGLVSSDSDVIFVSKGENLFIGKGTKIFVKNENGVSEFSSNKTQKDSISKKFIHTDHKVKNENHKSVSKVGKEETSRKEIRFSIYPMSSSTTFGLQNTKVVKGVLTKTIDFTGVFIKWDRKTVFNFVYDTGLFQKYQKIFLKQAYYNFIQSRPPPPSASFS